jgi:hypothetical protein
MMTEVLPRRALRKNASPKEISDFINDAFEPAFTALFRGHDCLGFKLSCMCLMLWAFK